jgi:ribosome-associated translation inhibitor RaiA
MQIQLNTDNHLSASEALAATVEAELRSTLDRFADRITRIEVHLSDTNSTKGGDDDKRCVMEARVSGRQPMSVTAQADNIEQAIDGATAKLLHALDTMFGKLEAERRNAGPPSSDEPA